MEAPAGWEPGDWDLDAEKDIIADACRFDFYLFCKYAFGFALNPKGAWFRGDIHGRLCRFFQRHTERWWARLGTALAYRLRMMIVFYRGGGKTMTITKAGQTWVHVRFDVDMSCYLDSITLDQSQEFLSSVLHVISGKDPYALFTWLYGNWYDPDRKWTDKRAVHACRVTMSLSDPSFACTSVDKGMTGKHPHLTFIDDLISQEKLKEDGNWIDTCVKHVRSILYAIKGDGGLVLTGTIYADNDVISTQVRDGGVFELDGTHEWPDARLEITPNGRWAVFFADIEDDEGNTVHEEAWSNDELDAMRNEDMETYMAQMRSRPGTGSHMPLSHADVDLLWVDDDDIPWDGMPLVCLCDTAFKNRDRRSRGDWNVMHMVGFDPRRNGIVYELDCRASRDWDADEWLRQLIKFCVYWHNKGHRIRMIVDERQPSGREQAYEALARMMFGLARIPMPPMLFLNRPRVKNQKTDKIIESLTYWKTNNVRLRRRVPFVHELIDQHVRAGATAKDDHADSFSDVFHPEVYMNAIIHDDNAALLPMGGVGATVGGYVPADLASYAGDEPEMFHPHPPVGVEDAEDSHGTGERDPFSRPGANEQWGDDEEW